MDIRQILMHLREGQSDRNITKELSVNRRTVRRYREWAAQQGLLEGELPSLEELHALLEETLPVQPPPQNLSSVEPYREQVTQWLKQNVEVAAIHCRLQERGYTGSYSAVHRFARKLQPHTPEATVRVECQPGQEAQLDFGYAGTMTDTDTQVTRRAWAFVMTLSWSRHQYVEFVFDQKIPTWLRLHRNALQFFGGVPQRLVVDNLKAAIIKACWDDPEVQHSYRECAQHYGFLIAPCRPYTPEHKGKVEQGGVHYVKRNFLGGREMTSLTQANQDVLVWCQQTAGLRVHGTTQEQPLMRFEQTEQACLKPLPETPYDMAVWKQVKLHRDCYVQFDKAYYSAPYQLIGQTLWACGGIQQLRLYTLDYQCVTTHERAPHPGARQTHPEHLPPEKLPGLTRTRESCLALAQELGEATLQCVQTLLDDPVLDRLPTVGRLLRLRERFGDARLENACARALAFGDPAYVTVKRILRLGLESASMPCVVRLPSATTFVRSTDELVGHLLGGEGDVSWN